MSNRADFSRADRVRKAIMREISDILRREIQNPELTDAVISVTDVALSNDLRHAKVYLSIFGEIDVQERQMEILQDHVSQIRSELGKRIRLRYTPEIQFFLDNSLERGSRITELLNQISRGEL